jgi:hypothetical protein
VVSDGEASFEATVAASCLLVPQLGDVALAYIDPEKVYILAVLERDPSKRAEVTLPSQTVISSRELDFASQGFTVNTSQAQFNVEELSATGNLMRLDFKVVHFLAGLVSSICRSLLACARSLTMRVEGSANFSSEVMRLSATEDLISRSARLDLKTTESVKIDGREIRLG